MKLIFIVGLIVSELSCGIKGPPLPPIETINDRVNNDTLNDTENSVSGTQTTAPISGDATSGKKPVKK